VGRLKHLLTSDVRSAKVAHVFLIYLVVTNVGGVIAGVLVVVGVIQWLPLWLGIALLIACPYSIAGLLKGYRRRSSGDA
jgi:uncharacterized protein (DUF983 family)